MVHPTTKEVTHDKLIERFSDFVKGTITGFDRIVFIRSTRIIVGIIRRP